MLQLQNIYEQLSNSNDLNFCKPLASAILADLNMRFSHYLMFSDSTQTQSAELASMTHSVLKLRWIKSANIEQVKDLFLNTLRFLSSIENQQDATKSGRFDETLDLKSLDSLPVRLIATERQERRFSLKLNFRVCNS